MIYIYFFCASILLFSKTCRVVANTLQEKANKIYQVIRCPSCDFQSIAESNSSIAEDLKEYILEHLKNGESKKEIIEFLTDRYGSSIYMNPFDSWESILFWVGPLFLFFILLICYRLFVRK